MRFASVLLLAALVLASIPVTAQSTPTVLIVDAAGDQKVTAGQLVVQEPAYDNVDVLEASVLETVSNGTAAIQLMVTTGAEMTATQRISLRFGIERGPTSLIESTAGGKDFVLVASPTTVTGADSAIVEASGATLTVTVPLSSLGAVGGDLLANLTIQSTDSNTGQEATALDDSSATDLAPDTGSAPPYTFYRVPPAAKLTATATTGRIVLLNGTTEAFTGTAATTTDANADVQFTVKVTNDGTDPETVTFTTGGSAGNNTEVKLSRPDATLLPGQSTNVTVTFRLNGASGTLSPTFIATGSEGGLAELTLAIQIPATAGTSEHTPVPEGLSFLTDLATKAGFVKAFGNYGELALLLAILLLVVVLIFLLMFLRGGAWVRIQVSPKHAVVAPGGVAQFQVNFSGKGGDRNARAQVRTEGWVSGLTVDDQTVQGDEGIQFNAPKNGDVAGVMRVQVPADAAPKSRHTVRLEAVPILEDGQELPKRRGLAKVVVQAGLDSTATEDYDSLDVHLDGIRHEPTRPAPGSTVTTTATLRNNGPAVARMRVVLMLDGQAAKEELVQLEPESTRDVRLQWTASAGSTRVKVQAFLA